MILAPDDFTFSLLGLPSFQQTSVVCTGDEVLYSSGRDRDETRRFTPSDDEWEMFWDVLDRLHAWDWEAEYTDPGILDGLQWAFSVQQGERRIKCHGANAFPPGFRILQGAINRLVEGMLTGDGYTESASSLLNAAETAGQIHAGPATAVPALIAALRKAAWDEAGMNAAVEGLGKLGRHAAPAIPTILETLAESYGVFIAYSGRDALSAIAGGLDSNDAESVRMAREILPAVVSVLCERKLSAEVRVSLVNVLVVAGFDQPGAVPALLDCLRDPDRSLFDRARYTLEAMTARPPEAIPILLDSLRARLVEKYGFASEILRALNLYGAAAAESALPILLDALEQPADETRTRAVEGLSELGPAARGAVPRLIAGLSSADTTMQWRSAETLGKIGPEAADAVPALIHQLATADGFIRWRAATALSKIGQPAAIPALVAALTVDMHDVPKNAGYALREFGPAAAVAIPELVRIVSVVSGPGHVEAAGVLGNLGPTAAAAIPALKAALTGDTSEWGRLACADALARIDPTGQAVGPALLAALNDPSVHVCLGIASALRRINCQPAAAIPALIKVAEGTSSSWIRVKAVEALGEFGAEANSAVPALKFALGDPERDVRDAALKTLQKMPGMTDIVMPPVRGRKAAPSIFRERNSPPPTAPAQTPTVSAAGSNAPTAIPPPAKKPWWKFW